MAESKVVSIRVPQTLLDTVDKLAETKYPSRNAGEKPNRTQVILDAIEAYISSPPDDVTKRHTLSAPLPDKLPSEWKDLIKGIVRAEVSTVSDAVNKRVDDIEAIARQMEESLGELTA